MNYAIHVTDINGRSKTSFFGNFENAQKFCDMEKRSEMNTRVLFFVVDLDESKGH